MSEALAAQLEPGRGALLRARHEALRRGQVRKLGRRIEHFEHLLGIGLPVGREPQYAACL
jgi:hypothetical protein